MEFNEHLATYLEEEEINKLISSIGNKEHKGLFLNTKKISAQEFKKMFPHVIAHPIVPNAFLFDQDEYQFGKMIYHDLGCYYIIDPSAVLVSYFLSTYPAKEVLDICAAPGGKSIVYSLLKDEKCALYSNDLSHSRANILLENIERIGLSNAVITSTDLSKVHSLANRFDAIILDAPCSGSGMFNKLEAMKEDWTFEKVKKASIIQKELIMLAYSYLKEGGTLIYSTCSYSKEEDEDVVNYLVDNTDAILEDIPDNSMFYRSKILNKTIHLFPHRYVGEGHYIAIIKKPGSLLLRKNIEPYFSSRISLGKGKEKIKYNFSLPFSPIKELENIAIRPGLFTTYQIANKEFISYHYSHFLSSITSYALSDEELKKYLHGEVLSFTDGQNYNIVSYQNINVGPVSSSGNSLKNLYPKKLRF